MQPKLCEALLSAAAGSDLHTHVGLLTIDLDGKAPTEMRLFKMGENDSTKGKFVFSERSAQLVMDKAKDWGNKFHLDWEHKTPLGAPNGDRSPAAAWFTLEYRPGNGLYAVGLNWTPKGKEDVEGRYYAYVSPWFDYDDETREVVHFKNAALTNMPALKQLEALASQNAGAPAVIPEKESPMDKAMLAALGLSETATQAEVTAKVAELKSFKSQVLSSTGAKSDFEAMTTMLSLKSAQENAAALTKQLEQSKEDNIKRERDALLSQAVTEGKLEPAGDLRKQLETQPVDLVKAMLASLPKKAGHVDPPKGAGANEPNKGTATATLSQEQIDASKRVARVFDNIKAEDIRKHHLELIEAEQDAK